jgi:hypothetical protein
MCWKRTSLGVSSFAFCANSRKMRRSNPYPAIVFGDRIRTN